MNTIDLQTALEICCHEAVIRQSYKDSRGKWTWSVGITSASGHGVERYIGKPQPLKHCLEVYAWLLEKYAKDVRKAFGRELKKHEFTAALSFHWNTGAILQAAWVKKYKAGDIAGARRSFMAWKSPSEIIPRRRAERDLFFDGKWSNDGTMTEYTRLTRRSTPDWKSARRITIGADLAAIFETPQEKPDQAKPDPGESLAIDAAVKQGPPPAVPQGWCKIADGIDLHGADKEDARKQLQRRLRDAGYYEVGAIDGKLGTRTAGAVYRFRVEQALDPTDGGIDQAFLLALSTGARAKVGGDRATATRETIAANSRTATVARKSKFRAALATGGATIAAAANYARDTVSGVFGNLDQATQALDPIKGFVTDMPGWIWLAGAALVAWTYYRSASQTEALIVEDYRSGKKP